MKRVAAEAVCAVLLAVSALAVLTAGPLTANAAVVIIDRLPYTARLLAAIAIAL